MLKKLLRENNVSWSTLSATYLNVNSGRRRTRSSIPITDPSKPHLPMEVILRILDFAVASDYPIIDPLSPSSEAKLTDAEKSRGNQVAIHFLCTCKALHEEGTKLFWESNTFIFTSPRAVRRLVDLPFEHRRKISHVTFRIVAKYYDDHPRKQRKLGPHYHPSVKGDARLKVYQRPKEIPLVRGGFRSYSWTQIVDFLAALRAPYDPSVKLSSKAPRPKLLPALTSLRLDLVNFSDTLLSFSGPEFHDVTSHEFGCTLNELQVTGMPEDDVGLKAAAELSGLLKDEGLYLDGVASFFAPLKGHLEPLKGEMWVPRVVRALKEADDDTDSEWDMSPDTIFSRGHTKIGVMPPAPAEVGHPKTALSDDRVIWKKVPVGRDRDQREWLLFSRSSGFEIDDTDDEMMCDCGCICGFCDPDESFEDSSMD